MFTNHNRKSGNEFERRLCEMLSAQGFWAHNLAQNSAGQPFDILAARNGKSYPIDAKVCKNNIFAVSRIEPNQLTAMRLWHETGNGVGWFALRMNDGSVYFFNHVYMEILGCQSSALSETTIREKGLPFGEWVKKCE